MQATLQRLAQRQLPSGQFPTIMTNVEERFSRQVSTTTPTYLITLLLTLFRERHRSHPLLDQIVERSTRFLIERSYRDPVEGYLVWHFNCFYPPDWEETCWCTYLLHQSGRLTTRQLEPLYRLLRANETEDNGIGVWLRDDYSRGNGRKNAFDPIVSLTISWWLEHLFHARSTPTNEFLRRCRMNNTPSLYYLDEFASFFFSLFGLAERPTLPPPETALFHQGSRRQVRYASADVWTAAQLFN